MSDFENEIWDRDYPTAEEQYQEIATEDVYEEEEEDDSDMYDEEFYEDFIEEYAEEEEEDAVNQATVRLDQGRLYQMLINHDLFDGVEADPKAINNVQKEIKEFMVKRMKVLLGMEVEQEPSEAQQVVVQSDFNELEVQALKMIASKVTKGRSEVDEPPVTVQSALNTVKAKPKANKINALGGNTKKTKPAPAKKAKPQSQGKPLRKQSQSKPKRKLKKEIVEKSNENLTVTDAAKRDINYIESIKNKSLEEANEIVAQRHKRPVPRTTIDQNVVNSHYQQKVATSQGTLSDFGRIMRLAAMQKANEK